MQFAQHKYERSRATWQECHVEADRLDQECHDLQRAVEEGEGRVSPLLTEYDVLCRSVAEQAREINRLKTDRALRDQELHWLRSSHAALKLKN